MQPYASTDREWKASINRCIVTTVRGQLRYRIADIDEGKGVILRAYGLFKVAPQSVTTSYWHQTCSLNPGVSVQVPFALGVGVTPNCGKTKVFATDYDSQANTSLYQDDTTPAKLGFKNQGRFLTPKKGSVPCVYVGYEAKAEVAGRSARLAKTHKICTNH